MPLLNGPKIRRMRERMGWTQEDMVDAAAQLLARLDRNDTRLSLRNLQKAEGGGRIGPRTIQVLALLLETEPQELLVAAPEKVSTVSAKEDRVSPGESFRPQAACLHVPELRDIGRIILSPSTILDLRRRFLRYLQRQPRLYLHAHGISLHDGEDELWPTPVVEGFLSACVYFLAKARGTDSYTANMFAFTNTTFMGQHGLELWNSADPTITPLDDDFAESGVVRWWKECEFCAGTEPSRELHGSCPALDSNEYYTGWLQFSMIFCGNAMSAIEESRDRSIDEYAYMAADCFISYLHRHESKLRPGHDFAWLVIRTVLERWAGIPVKRSKALEKALGMTVDKFLDRLEENMRVFELEKQEIIRHVTSACDRATGLELAMLFLQTRFLFVGRKREDGTVEIRIARHPPEP